MIYYNIPWNSNKNLGKAYNDFMMLLPFDDDYACFVDGDATFLTNNFGKQLEDIIAKHPECGIFTARTNRVKYTPQIIGDWNSNDMASHREFATQLQGANYDEVTDISDIGAGCFSGVLILIKKDTWRKIGGFSNGLLGVDNALHIAAYKKFEKVYLMNGVYLYHWYRGGNANDKSHLLTGDIANDPTLNVLARREAAIAARKKRGNVKKIIYSAITGEYEQPLPIEIPPGWEYRLYSNKKGVGTHFIDDPTLSDVKLARRIKILPWEYFEFDVCVWIDGNTVFKKGEIEKLCQYDFVISKHPERDCIYQEARALLHFGKDSLDLIEKIVERYQDEGMPEHGGMVASHAIVRKNTPQNKLFCEKWWSEVRANSHRDQMSFNYILWKHPISIHYIEFKSIFRPTSLHRNGKTRIPQSGSIRM